MSKNSITIKPKENAIHERWNRVNTDDVCVTVNEVHYRLDTDAREQAFIDNQFPTQADKERYAWYRNEWYRRANEFDAGTIPLAVTCELVSHCNLGCAMCYTITDEFQNAVVGAQRMLPWPIVKAVIDECAALKVPSMLFSWRGESTMYRSVHEGKQYRFPDVLKYAREKGILEITSLTHGQLMDKDMAQGIIEAEPNWISFSVDGLEPAYNKIRTPKARQNTNYNAFKKITENIQYLVALRNEQGKTRPQIRVNTIYPAIADNRDAYQQFMAELGVDLVTVNELLDFRVEELPDSAIMDNWACQYPFQRLTISANGILLPCTGAHNEESGLVLGRYQGSPPKVVRNTDGSTTRIDVPELDLKTCWHNAKLEEIRKIHKEGNRKTINPGCKYCRHGVKKHGPDWIPQDWDMDTMEWKGHTWME
ncbi:hypothetical protein GF373_14705 [bacterium]|nr:hypothetical protein [bacterium]